MTIETKYDMWQMVYLKTDEDQYERMVTGIDFRGKATIYLLSHGTYESSHFEEEITEEIDMVKKTR